MQSALPKHGILEKKKTKGGHTSLHFKSKYKDILTETQTKDMFNRIGIPESDWHIYIGLTCGKVATAVHQGNGGLFNTSSLWKCVFSWKQTNKKHLWPYFLLRREILIRVREQWDIMLQHQEQHHVALTISHCNLMIYKWGRWSISVKCVSSSSFCCSLSVESSDSGSSLGLSCVSGCSGEGFQPLQAPPGAQWLQVKAAYDLMTIAMAISDPSMSSNSMVSRELGKHWHMSYERSLHL